jgi:hypothetical protein
MVETVERCARDGDPLVITGTLAWPAIGAWTPEVLRRFGARAPVESLSRELRDQLGVPPFCRDARGLRADVSIGAAETFTQVRFDLLHTLVAQVHGRTRFLIFPAKERANLYPFPVSSGTPHVSRVDLAAPDLVAFPRLSAARGFHCDLREGELLLIPARVWQSARPLVTSITAEFRWPPLAMLPAVMAWDALKRLRGG